MGFVGTTPQRPHGFLRRRWVWALAILTLVLFVSVFGVLVGTGTRPSFLGGDEKYPSFVVQVIDGCQRLSHTRLSATLADGANGDHRITLSGTVVPPRKYPMAYDGTVDGPVAETGEDCDIRIEVTTELDLPDTPTFGPSVQKVEIRQMPQGMGSLYSRANARPSSRSDKATTSYLLPLDPSSVPSGVAPLESKQIATTNGGETPTDSRGSFIAHLRSIYPMMALEERYASNEPMASSVDEFYESRAFATDQSDEMKAEDTEVDPDSIATPLLSQSVPVNSKRTDVLLSFGFRSGAFNSGWKKLRLHLLLALWNSEKEKNPVASRQSMVQVFFPYKALRLASAAPVTFSWGADLEKNLDAVIWDGRQSAPYTHYTGVVAGADVEFDENDVVVSAETLTIISSAVIGAAISSIIGLFAGAGGGPTCHAVQPETSGQKTAEPDEPDSQPPSGATSSKQDNAIPSETEKMADASRPASKP